MIDRAVATARKYAGHPFEPARPLKEPSRKDLRAMLAEAARNTAELEINKSSQPGDRDARS